MKITEINRNTNLNILSNEDICSAINDYFRHKEDYKQDNRNIETMRKLLYVAKTKNLFPDLKIRAMGLNVE